MLIDTHAHLDFKEFDKDRKETIERAFSNGVKKIINVGCDLKTSKNSIKLSNRYENIFAAIGIHPGEINEQKTINREQTINELKKMAENEKVVAIGEIGLDYNNKSKVESQKLKVQFEIQNLQKEILKAQIELARELNLPIIFHCRMAHSDLLEIIKKFPACHRAVIHCFTGNYQQAKEYLKMGFYLGFGGIIFKMNLDEIIKKIPLDRILIETDCPFLTPLPRQSSEKLKAGLPRQSFERTKAGLPRQSSEKLKAGLPRQSSEKLKAGLPRQSFERTKAGVQFAKTNRNEPVFVKHTVQKIAEIKKMSFQEIEKATTQNAEKLFGV